MRLSAACRGQDEEGAKEPHFFNVELGITQQSTCGEIQPPRLREHVTPRLHFRFVTDTCACLDDWYGSSKVTRATVLHSGPVIWVTLQHSLRSAPSARNHKILSSAPVQIKTQIHSIRPWVVEEFYLPIIQSG